MSNSFKLKPHIIVEPLVNNWYAWINLISPMTYSKYMQYHLQLLKSYLEAPHLHKQASQERRLRGGPFLDLSDAVQLNRVADLYRDTETRCADLIALSKAIDQLNFTLSSYQLSPGNFNSLYQDLPVELKGFVELVYDLNNQPSFRLIESLLYKSDLYKPELQSVLLYELDPDQRPFILSTPRIASHGALEVNVPFASEFYDRLFNAREYSLTAEELRHLFDTYLQQSDLEFNDFRCLFHSVENTTVNDVDKSLSEFSVEYFGHACVLIRSPDCNILIDPLVTYENTRDDLSRFSLSDLPDQIDIVILTHSHQDHAVLETLLQIRYKIKTIIVPQNNAGALQDPSLKLALQSCGFDHVVALSELEQFSLSGVNVIALPFLGEHADLDIRSKSAYVVTVCDQSMMFLADSKNLDPMLYQRLAHILPPIDTLFLGLECEGAPLSWLYGPLMYQPLSRQENQSRRLNGSDAAEGFDIIQALHCRRVYIYAMANEPWLTFISTLDRDTSQNQVAEANKLVQICRSHHLDAELLYGCKKLNIGKTINSIID